MPKRYLEAAVAAAEVSISITYGEQQNRQTTQVQVNQAQASQMVKLPLLPEVQANNPISTSQDRMFQVKQEPA
ncbi:hypothetical protein NELON_10215 [Neisseria elongata subsp. glycolytica ATCC 29315]|uniref:Uncharacterized protein n=1 Tax=Neisseria elongata subsp. glycolytica ATCC 29315 TaxID=546263 RepID=D4DSJ7_NEIEG|nr:hypothetical protein NELON_10215 [Neisseria elongata subsp. glycolytica ATCC 29315]EFE49170.1 hypothetical protein NEIELOOT_02042 [Neisseria elongata subsp. glycolytica ATCC 29315]